MSGDRLNRKTVTVHGLKLEIGSVCNRLVSQNCNHFYRGAKFDKLVKSQK